MEKFSVHKCQRPEKGGRLYLNVQGEREPAPVEKGEPRASWGATEGYMDLLEDAAALKLFNACAKKGV